MVMNSLICLLLSSIMFEKSKEEMKKKTQKHFRGWDKQSKDMETSTLNIFIGSTNNIDTECETLRCFR